MSVSIRDAFVHLHSSNVLENLLAEVRLFLHSGQYLLTGLLRIQFRARYRGYKVPISSFRSKSQYKAIENVELSPEVDELIRQQLNNNDAEDEEAEVDIDAESPEEPLDEEEPRKMKKSTKRTKQVADLNGSATTTKSEKMEDHPEIGDVDHLIKQKYVDLVDIFPPIPEKGKFNIETIKDSPYFFS